MKFHYLFSYNTWIEPRHGIYAVAISIPSCAFVDIHDIREVFLIHWSYLLQREVLTELAAVIRVDLVAICDSIYEVTHRAASIACNAMQVVFCEATPISGDGWSA